MKSKCFALLLLLALLAACTLVLVACGGGSGPDALSAPTDFAYNGSILSWGAVEGAEKYSVVIGSGEPFSTGSTGYPFINTSGETFTVPSSEKALYQIGKYIWRNIIHAEISAVFQIPYGSTLSGAAHSCQKKNLHCYPPKLPTSLTSFSSLTPEFSNTFSTT